MADELKLEMRKLENLIGYKIVDVTSKSTTDELIEALNSKYKSDLKNSIRLHRLEFYHALIEDARNKKKKSVEFEEKFLLSKDDEEDSKNEFDEKPEEKEEEELKKPADVVSVPPKDIDEWKNLLTMSKIYYVLEHPMSEGLTWERNIRKKKQISKFNDKDLIEWRVAQNFRLKALEEWALSRSEARKLADESPYDFDDLLDDDESRELEDMFIILGTQKQKKPDLSVLEKVIRTKRPFKFKDEGMEDWTESYSDDSEESVDKHKEKESSSDEPSIGDEDSSLEIFSSYKEIPKYRRPIFEEMEETKDIKEWWTLCHEAVGEAEKFRAVPSPPAIRVTSTIEEKESFEAIEEFYSASSKERMWPKKSNEKESLMNIDEEDVEYDNTIRRQSTKGHVQLIAERAKARAEIERKTKEQPSRQISKEDMVDLDSILRMESSSKSRIGKKNEEDDFGAIPFKSFASRDRKFKVREDNDDDDTTTSISSAECSASTKTSKPTKENASPDKKESDLDSLLRKESVSRSRVGKKGDENQNKDIRVSSISKNAVENKNNLLVSEAKLSGLNITKGSSNEKNSRNRYVNLDSLIKESFSKSKINGIKVVKDVKDSSSKSSFNVDNENTFNSEAKSPALNVVEVKKPSTEQDSSERDPVMEEEFLLKNKTAEAEVENKLQIATSEVNTNEVTESTVKSEIKSLISDAKSSVLKEFEEDANSSKASDLKEKHSSK